MYFVSHSPTEWFTKSLIKSCLKNIHIPELRMTLTVHDCSCEHRANNYSKVMEAWQRGGGLLGQRKICTRRGMRAWDRKHSNSSTSLGWSWYYRTCNPAWQRAEGSPVSSQHWPTQPLSLIKMRLQIWFLGLLNCSMTNITSGQRVTMFSIAVNSFRFRCETQRSATAMFSLTPVMTLLQWMCLAAGQQPLSAPITRAQGLLEPSFWQSRYKLDCNFG